MKAETLVPGMLTRLRVEKGWSVERAADEVGVSLTLWRQFEAGTNWPPRKPNLLALAFVFDLAHASIAPLFVLRSSIEAP